MAQELGTKKVRDDAEMLARVWEENADLKIKGLTLAELKAEDVALGEDETELATLRDQITTVLNRRNDRRKRLRTMVTRGRAGVKGYFGSDSTEYERVGGTRTSEQK